MNYKLIISYDGKDFFGFQKQLELRTVEKALGESLIIIFKEEIKIFASGRTDRGVHALHQVINFKSEINIPPENLKKAINKILPRDIFVKEVFIVKDEFHARHDCIKKDYIYLINNHEYNCLRAGYETFIPYKLDVTKMQNASKYLLGTHDFKGFTTADNEAPSIKTIYKILIEEKEGMISLEFSGNGFLKYMVRSMVGVLIEIGLSRKKSEVIDLIFQERRRDKCGRIANPEGLYLKMVYYND